MQHDCSFREPIKISLWSSKEESPTDIEDEAVEPEGKKVERILSTTPSRTGAFSATQILHPTRVYHSAKFKNCNKKGPRLQAGMTYIQHT